MLELVQGLFINCRHVTLQLAARLLTLPRPSHPHTRPAGGARLQGTRAPAWFHRCAPMV